MELSEYAARFKKFADGFGTKVVHTIQRHGTQIEGLVREQLYAGRDGKEKLLSPTYLNDPYFNSPESGRWYRKPRWYMGWKAHITPPSSSYIGLPARPREVPNLIIRGDFYDSITTMPINGGVMIRSEGVKFGRDIERKYGSDIFRLGPHAVSSFVIDTLATEIEDYRASCGI